MEVVVIATVHRPPLGVIPVGKMKLTSISGRRVVDLREKRGQFSHYPNGENERKYCFPPPISSIHRINKVTIV